MHSRINSCCINGSEQQQWEQMESRFLSRGRAGEQGWKTNSRLASLSEGNNLPEAARPGSKRFPIRAPRRHGRCFDRVQAMKTLNLP